MSPDTYLESLNQGRILIVDDEPMVTTSIATMLNLESEYEAEAFNSPVEALAAQKDSEPPDVVVSDFLMPEMDGITFLKAMRERFPETTLILLTGYADKENAIQAINEVGIYRYIEKPWDNEALKLAIRHGVERTRLLGRLREKIVDLERAKSDLKEYSEHLEERVTEKTRDLMLTLNKLQAVVENTGDGILTLGAQGQILSANATFARWCKTSQESLEGGALSDYLQFKEPLPLSDILKLKSSQLREGQVADIIIEVNISPLSGQKGAVLVCRDIVKRKEAERLREDFVSTLTHGLRIPLLSAIRTIGFFLDGTLGEIPARQGEMLTMMKGSNEQMLSLVNDLLEVYRYEARQQKLVVQKLQLADLIYQVALELQSLASTKNQALETDVRGPIPEILGDKQALRRVLTNLIGNAIHYTPAGGHIEIHAEEKDGKLVLSVKDNGRGIPKGDLAKLFQRFAQGTSRHRVTGTGLGLYLSRQIIEAHGGRIWAESEEGKGSIFSFQLAKAK